MSTRRELLRAARSGDMNSQFALGCEYDFEPPKDKKRAIYWYRSAAALGHARAQNFLGESYRDGWTVRRNSRKAVAWFRAAAAQGEPNAQLSYGASLFYGEGVRRDRAAALAWYRRAARQGVDSAMFNIAQNVSARGRGRSRLANSHPLVSARGESDERCGHALARSNLRRSRKVSAERSKSVPLADARGATRRRSISMLAGRLLCQRSRHDQEPNGREQLVSAGRAIRR